MTGSSEQRPTSWYGSRAARVRDNTNVMPEYEEEVYPVHRLCPRLESNPVRRFSGASFIFSFSVPDRTNEQKGESRTKKIYEIFSFATLSHHRTQNCSKHVTGNNLPRVLPMNSAELQVLGVTVTKTNRFRLHGLLTWCISDAPRIYPSSHQFLTLQIPPHVYESSVITTKTRKFIMSHLEEPTAVPNRK
jgi:hypothetical protein